MKHAAPLSPLQKMAWFNLTVFATAVALYIVCVPLLALFFDLTLAKAALPALGLFGICGIWGFGSLFFYDRRRRAKVKLDEREESIYRGAALIGMIFFWEVFVALCMGVWAILRYFLDQSTVPIEFLPGLVFVGMIVFTVTQSIAILLKYKWSSDGAA